MSIWLVSLHTQNGLWRASSAPSASRSHVHLSMTPSVISVIRGAWSPRKNVQRVPTASVDWLVVVPYHGHCRCCRSLEGSSSGRPSLDWAGLAVAKATGARVCPSSGRPSQELWSRVDGERCAQELCSLLISIRGLSLRSVWIWQAGLPFVEETVITL